MSAGRMELEGPMTFATARALSEQGAAALGPGACVIDLAGVSDIDSSALAVLFAWARAAASRGGSITLAHVPANLSSLAELYGVSDLLPAAA
ncbi:MAG: STAS domain-containing protein [Rhodocyclaceae bacterium]|nr:STAS domain-containing protein [Rhodocyclaceae bacterium]MBX3669325.1 STAS domain-containing protein [Rhodocyclaceae bacterium]